MIWMLWLALGLCVVGAKYYTALGGRRLERRLNRVKADLEQARQRLKEQKEKETLAAAEEEVVELRLRYMKELMEDIKVRLSQREERPAVAGEAEGRPAVLPVFTNY